MTSDAQASVNAELAADCRARFEALVPRVASALGLHRAMPQVSTTVTPLTDFGASVRHPGGHPGRVVVEFHMGALVGLHAAIEAHATELLRAVLADLAVREIDEAHVLTLVYDTALTFIQLHELFHLLGGHLDFRHREYGLAELSELSLGYATSSPTGLSEELAYALELEADGNALDVMIGKASFEALLQQAEAVLQENKANRNTEGVLQRDLRSEDNRYQFIRVKPMGTSFDMEQGAQTLRKIDKIIQSLDPEAENLEVAYSGAMPVNQDQHRTMTNDLTRASLLALIIVLLVLTLFTGQPGAPIILAGPLAMGIGGTLAITTLTIGQLNLVSGFLVTALVGVGVDYGIHLYLRYLEALRGHDDRGEAMIEAIRFTFPGCLTSGLTTFAAFVAMTFSDFRGFQEYGQIAATGVVLTLLSTFVVMPPLALLLTRRPGRAGTSRALPSVFGLRYAWAVVVAGIALTIYSIPAGFQIRYHNEFKKELRGYSEASEFQSNVVEKSLGGSLNPAVVAVADISEARKVEDLVNEAIAKEGSQFARVLSLASLVPVDLDDRAEIVERIREEIESIPLDRLKEEERKQVDEYLALTKAQPWQVDDIPRRFNDCCMRSIDR